MLNNEIDNLLGDCPWVDSRQWLDDDPDSRNRRILVELSASGHDLVRDHGMQEFDQRMLQHEADDVQFELRSDAGPWPAAPESHEHSFPRVLSQLDDTTTKRFLLNIGNNLDWFRGHFPGNPVLPGIVQLHWAVSVAQACYDYQGVPSEVLRLKFKSVVVPPTIVELAISSPRRGEIQFNYSGLGNQYSEGRLRFSENTQ